MHVLFQMVGGSRAYGLNTPTSDVDNRGVFLNEDLGHVLGLRKHEHQEFTTDGADDKFKEFRRFMNLLKEANTEALEMLYATESTSTTSLFESVRARRRELVDSKRLMTCLCGYMEGELRRANGELKGKMGKRKDALEQYGFSPKNFVQLFRLAWAGKVFFEQGFFPVNVKEHDPALANELLTLKMSPTAFTRDQLNALAVQYRAQLEKAYANRAEDYRFNEALADEFVLLAYYPVVEAAHQKLMLRDMFTNLPPSAEQISAQYHQHCSCAQFQERFGVHIDSQDLREGGYTHCPYCEEEFPKNQ